MRPSLCCQQGRSTEIRSIRRQNVVPAVGGLSGRGQEPGVDVLGEPIYELGETALFLAQ